MDLTKQNEASCRDKATCIKDLDTCRKYLVTELKNQNTMHGPKIVAELEKGQYIFLSTSVCKYLQQNLNEYMFLQDAANKLKLVIYPLGGFKIKFKIV